MFGRMDILTKLAIETKMKLKINYLKKLEL
jgi:hypothetical protein